MFYRREWLNNAPYLSFLAPSMNPIIKYGIKTNAKIVTYMIFLIIFSIIFIFKLLFIIIIYSFLFDTKIE